MFPYIYAERNGIHVIDLVQTARLLTHAYEFVQKASQEKKSFLFVGTKRQAREIVKEEAERAGCPYVNHRWLGGMLTNFKTVKQSIKRLNEYETMIADGSLDKLKKREALTIRRDHEKLVRSIGGIKEMTSLPDAIFVIDVGFESGAVEEATKLGIPVVGIVDSNNSIENISYVIPGNDDSSRAIRLYSRGMADAVLAGKNQAITELAKSVSEETTEEE